MARILTPLLRPLVWMIAYVCGGGKSPQFRGGALIPRSGGVLIVANHISDFDPILVQYICPRPVWFMAKRELFDMPAIAGLVRLFRAFPVEQTSAAQISALRKARNLLAQGEVVCLFPEGRISPSGDLLPVLPGAAMLARRPDVVTVAIAIEDADTIVAYGTTRLRIGGRRTVVTVVDTAQFGPDSPEELVLGWMSRNLTVNPRPQNPPDFVQ